MIIRQEQPTDYEEVYELVKATFAASTNEGEWDYLNEVRRKIGFIPELSLVAQMEDGSCRPSASIPAFSGGESPVR